MLAVIGENVVDIMPAGHGLYQPCLGGSPFNVVIGAARRGIDVCYLSPLSQDHFGQQFARYLADNGARYGLPFFSPAPSSLAMVSVDAQQQPQYSLYRSGIADRAVSAEQQIAALASDCKLLHLGSLALEPQDAPRIRAVLQAAAAKQILISVDINVRLNAVSDVSTYHSFLSEVTALSQFIKASDEDLQLLYPQLSTTDALAALRATAPTALIALTEGDKGATLYWQQHQISLAVIPPTSFVDTVGAGDTFWANLLAALLQLGLPTAAQISAAQLTQCLQQAMLAASLNIARQGCNPPNSAELAAALLQLQSAKG
ncbi:PfkB family carbohydrate kinase [Rheinheimera pacifica]|uniref:PfkB family carbohydrate kinase n=1 Tax=Rheinheimera pacifica TaxID=173990 RepID=UPI002ED92AF2